MGFLDNIKDKAAELGEKAKEGFESAKDHAADFADDVRDRFDGDDTPGEPLGDVVDEPTSASEDPAFGAATTVPADIVEPQIADAAEPPATFGDANPDDVLGTGDDRRPDPDPI